MTQDLFFEPAYVTEKILQDALRAAYAEIDELREALEEMRYSHTDKAEAMYQAVMSKGKP